MSKLLNINFSPDVYETVVNQGLLPPEYASKLETFLDIHGFSKLLLFGEGITGKAVKKSTGSRFTGFVNSDTLEKIESVSADCIIITTAPIHVEHVKKKIANSSLAHLPIISLFQTTAANIRLILETQPRSGTDYMITSLQKSLGLGYASTFAFPEGELSGDGHLFYGQDTGQGYVVKTHFTRPLHYPEYRYVPTLFLISFFPDTYYKWARMLAPEAERQQFVLNPKCKEWSMVQAYMPLHLQWLNYIKRLDYIRFEDMYLDFNSVMEKFEAMVGEYPDNFPRPNTPSRRIYFTGDFARCMTRDIADYLLRYFAGPIRQFYPEKTGLIP